jgi:cell division septation protein DedD
MITVPPASEESAAPEPSGPAAAKEPLPLVWIPATLCVGLLIAAVYLGGRIVTAHSHSIAHVQSKPAVTHAAPVVTKADLVVPAAAPVTPAPAVQAKAEPKPEAPKHAKAEAPTEAPQHPADGAVPMIAPHDGERYIQVAALDLERTRRYVGHLRDAKLEPHVAPGPTPEMLRVLIGPFTDRESLASTRSQLDRAGIANFVREY